MVVSAEDLVHLLISKADPMAIKHSLGLHQRGGRIAAGAGNGIHLTLGQGCEAVGPLHGDQLRVDTQAVEYLVGTGLGCTARRADSHDLTGQVLDVVNIGIVGHDDEFLRECAPHGT